MNLPEIDTDMLLKRTARGEEDAIDELSFVADIVGEDVNALRLAFDIEAWSVNRRKAADLGEAAYRAFVEADFSPAIFDNELYFVAEDGAGVPLVWLDGNLPANRVHFRSRQCANAWIVVGSTDCLFRHGP